MSESRKEDEYLDMYGVSPCMIAFLMTLVTLLSPYASYHVEFVFFGFFIMPGLYAPAWVWFYGFSPGIHFLNPFFSFTTFLLGIPNLVFLVWIIRYYQGKTSRFNAITVGAVSVLFPLLVALSSLNLEFLTVYNGPVPIQFIIGLVLLYRIEGPELKTAWEGQLHNQKWWERPRYKYSLPEVDTEPDEDGKEDGEWLRE